MHLQAKKQKMTLSNHATWNVASQIHHVSYNSNVEFPLRSQEKSCPCSEHRYLMPVLLTIEQHHSRKKMGVKKNN